MSFDGSGAALPGPDPALYHAALAAASQAREAAREAVKAVSTWNFIPVPSEEVAASLTARAVNAHTAINTAIAFNLVIGIVTDPAAHTAVDAVVNALNTYKAVVDARHATGISSNTAMQADFDAYFAVGAALLPPIDTVGVVGAVDDNVDAA
jgi:hypothetical protein